MEIFSSPYNPIEALYKTLYKNTTHWSRNDFVNGSKLIVGPRYHNYFDDKTELLNIQGSKSNKSKNKTNNR